MKSIITFFCFFILYFSTYAYATDDEYNNAVQFIQERKFEDALPILQKLAAEGDLDAQNNLGAMYEHGHGIAIDLKKAAYWYLESAKKGSFVAQHNIGVAYFSGRGVKKDEEEGLAWIFMAASGGIAESNNVAMLMKKKMEKQQIDKSLIRYQELNRQFGLLNDTPETFRLN